MKVCGFTFVRNAITFDYPVVEAISSILPLCDEVVVVVGNSEDDTLGLIRSIPSSKVRIVESVWDESLREGGHVLAQETNKALAAIPGDTDWCFYLQADEVLHERYHDTVRKDMERYLHDESVEGLLFRYEHFYGSYDYVGDSWRWYRKEIRVVRRHPDVFSYQDAQGFRKKPNTKLRVKETDAAIYHYGWVRDPRAMGRKLRSFSKLYHDDAWVDTNIAKAELFDYSWIDSLNRFNGTHPMVMQDRIRRKNWVFDHNLSKNRLTLREKLKRLVSRLVGFRVAEYRNYRLD